MGILTIPAAGPVLTQVEYDTNNSLIEAVVNGLLSDENIIIGANINQDKLGNARTLNVTYVNGITTSSISSTSQIPVGGQGIAVTGDSLFNDMITINSGGLLVSLGGITISSGGLNVITDSVNITVGNLNVLGGGITVSVGDIDVSLGGINLPEGDLTLTNGDLTLTNGSLVIGAGATGVAVIKTLTKGVSGAPNSWNTVTLVASDLDMDVGAAGVSLEGIFVDGNGVTSSCNSIKVTPTSTVIFGTNTLGDTEGSSAIESVDTSISTRVFISTGQSSGTLYATVMRK